MNAEYAYRIVPSFPFLIHWGKKPATVGDYVSVDSDKIDVQVQSGDYFITLATVIEVLSQRPANQSVHYTEELERIANELLYLQNYYEISKKKS